MGSVYVVINVSDAPIPLFTSRSNTDIIYFETGRYQYFALEAYNLFSLLFIISHHTESQQLVITKAL